MIEDGASLPVISAEVVKRQKTEDPEDKISLIVTDPKLEKYSSVDDATKNPEDKSDVDMVQAKPGDTSVIVGMALTNQGDAAKPEQAQQVQEPAPEPSKKKMTTAEIMSKLDEFNRELDILTAKLGISVPLTDAVDEYQVPILVPSTDVD